MNLLRILVVDDERIIAGSLAYIFADAGYDCRAVHSAESALAALASFTPDVIIADVMMGAMNGIELAVIVAETLPDCKVVLFSGLADTDELIPRSLAIAPQFLVIAKPAHPRVLLELMETESARRFGRRIKVPRAHAQTGDSAASVGSTRRQIH